MWVWEWAWACQMCVPPSEAFLLSCPLSPCICKRADLKEGVTDEGLRVLASAGCGEKLTSLTLQCRCCCVQFDGVLEWEVERACRMCDAG